MLPWETQLRAPTLTSPAARSATFPAERAGRLLRPPDLSNGPTCYDVRPPALRVPCNGSGLFRNPASDAPRTASLDNRYEQHLDFYRQPQGWPQRKGRSRDET